MNLHTNIYEIRWKNYRAFKDTDWITLKPLTLLIGPNNSGKTSILSPLLLMDQTMSSREAVAPLVTRGPVIDLGPYRNIVHRGDMDKELFLGFRFHVHTGSPRKLSRLGAYPPGAVEVKLAAKGQSSDPLLQRFELKDLFDRSLFSQTLRSDGNYSFSSEWIRSLDPRELNAIEKSKPVNFLFSPASALRGYQPEHGDETAIQAKFSKPFSMYLGALGYMFEELRDIFRDLVYIGPLRDRPHRYYEVSDDMPPSVGSHGEHMASVLRRRMPTIGPRLNAWVRRFEFGRALKLKKLSTGQSTGQFFSLLFIDSDTSRETNIADSGFGASQVLPLIVQALTAPPGSLTIAEQPEIHLNPRLQYTLADLFVEMANNNRRIIVETHSEHLVLRLRRLIAMGKIDAENVSLYFVEKTEGVSTIKSIPVQKDGQIQPESWPRGFFEDGLRESLALATAQAARTSKSSRKPSRADKH